MPCIVHECTPPQSRGRGRHRVRRNAAIKALTAAACVHAASRTSTAGTCRGGPHACTSACPFLAARYPSRARPPSLHALSGSQTSVVRSPGCVLSLYIYSQTPKRCARAIPPASRLKSIQYLGILCLRRRRRRIDSKLRHPNQVRATDRSRDLCVYIYILYSTRRVESRDRVYFTDAPARHPGRDQERDTRLSLAPARVESCGLSTAESSCVRTVWVWTFTFTLEPAASCETDRAARDPLECVRLSYIDIGYPGAGPLTVRVCCVL